jgi:hypothetical protein
MNADPAIYTGTHNGRRLLVRRYPDGFTTLTTTLRAHEDWEPEAELTAVSLAEVV